jgi:hypothetical protein
MRHVAPTICSMLTVLLILPAASPDAQEMGGMQKWVQGKGWGWVWGPQDEVGALNEMTDATRLAAIRLITQGKTDDLGLPYDRNSYKWPGHSPGEIMSFRSPEGVDRQQDLPFTTDQGGNTSNQGWPGLFSSAPSVDRRRAGGRG